MIIIFFYTFAHVVCRLFFLQKTIFEIKYVMDQIYISFRKRMSFSCLYINVLLADFSIKKKTLTSHDKA
jgi:hypothetical protein